ncbi:hypothetical protein QN277_016437 [Acacia crassicarpa]|uniref:Uncharacterized protein n=1 Tax=Acacia crassicarpa TaxID=499986 RepID=A0AAE1MWN0_9FABA|nr:hypothetical protein QN277_016437 [Acacia crassicarpa]
MANPFSTSPPRLSFLDEWPPGTIIASFCDLQLCPPSYDANASWLKVVSEELDAIHSDLKKLKRRHELYNRELRKGENKFKVAMSLCL